MLFLQTGEREHHQIATGFLTCACHCGRIRFPPEIILFTDTRGGSFLMGVTVRWTFAAALAVRRSFEEPRSAHCQEKRETKLFPGNRSSACLWLRYYFDEHSHKLQRRQSLQHFQEFPDAPWSHIAEHPDNQMFKLTRMECT